MIDSTRHAAVWERGQHEPAVFVRDRWITSALLVLAALVLAVFVGILVQDVRRRELHHEAQRVRARAAAQCEFEPGVGARVRCLALFDRAGDAAQP